MGYAYENKMTLPFTCRPDGADRKLSSYRQLLSGTCNNKVINYTESPAECIYKSTQ
jgi:hypothetical protein